MVVISHAKLQNKCLNVREQVEVLEWNKKWSLSLLSCESSMSVKENPDRKKKLLKPLLRNQMIWMMFMKIMKNTIEISNAKYWPFLMIWWLICLVIKNNSTATEIFIGGRNLDSSLVFIIEFCYTKKYCIKFYTLLHYESLKQPRYWL